MNITMENSTITSSWASVRPILLAAYAEAFGESSNFNGRKAIMNVPPRHQRAHAKGARAQYTSAALAAGVSDWEIREWDYRGRPPAGVIVERGGDAARGWAIVRR